MKQSFTTGRIYHVVVILFFAVFLYGCDRNRNNPGWDYFPDMFYSTAYETFTKNPNFENGMTMRLPVPGTVPREFTPFNYTNDPDSRKLAGNELVNPISANTETLAVGKKVYTTFCLVCHGASGGGNGPLYESGLYPLRPRILTDAEAVKLKDGEIFHTITVGYGSMGAHGSQIKAEDIWSLVLYVRSLQNEAGTVLENKEVSK
jgi:mono/diheme cytochrome c family protein